MRRAWVVVVVTVAVAAAGASGSVAAAPVPQTGAEPETTIIRLVTDPSDPLTIAELVHGEIAVYADGVLCTSVAPTPEVRTFSIEVGLATQPEECRREGATITFFDGAGRQLVEEAAVSPGATIRIVNLAPYPPSSGPVALPGSGSGGLGEAGGTGTWTVVAVALAAAGALSAGMGVRRAWS